jgi:hypothetical protein
VEKAIAVALLPVSTATAIRGVQSPHHAGLLCFQKRYWESTGYVSPAMRPLISHSL